MFRSFISILGGTYHWYREGRKESFFKGVILKNSSQEEMTRDYYTGLIFFLIFGAIVTLLYIFYMKITNQEIS